MRPAATLCLALVFFPAPLAAQDKKARLTVSGGAVSFNDKTFRLPCPKEDVIAVLGKPDRVQKLENQILVWDKLGLFAYARGEKEEVFGLNAALGDMRKYLKFAPAAPFEGTLIVDSAPIQAKSDIEAINRGKKGDPFRMATLTFSWRATEGGFAYFLNRGTTDRFTDRGDFVEFSVEYVGRKK